MKRSHKQYAKLLYELTAGKKGKELDSILDDFLNFLQKERKGGLLEKILHFYERYYNEMETIHPVRVTVAHEVNDKTKKKIEEWLKEKGKEVEVHVSHDPTVLGGLRLRWQDTLLDATLQQKISTLRTILQEND